MSLAARHGLWVVLLLLTPACSRETWVLDAEGPLLRSEVACPFDVQRQDQNSVRTRLAKGTSFTVRRQLVVDGRPCWFIRTTDGLDGWLAFDPGRAHRIR